MRISDWSSGVCSSDLDQHGDGEDHHRDLELVRALLALRIVGDDDEVAAGGGLRQVLPDAVQHQHVAGAQRHVARVLAQHVLVRSEEHTSELQSLMRISYAVFCLKKKKTNIQKRDTAHIRTLYITYS